MWSSTGGRFSSFSGGTETSRTLSCSQKKLSASMAVGSSICWRDQSDCSSGRESSGMGGGEASEGNCSSTSERVRRVDLRLRVGPETHRVSPDFPSTSPGKATTIGLGGTAVGALEMDSICNAASWGRASCAKADLDSGAAAGSNGVVSSVWEGGSQCRRQLPAPGGPTAHSMARGTPPLPSTPPMAEGKGGARLSPGLQGLQDAYPHNHVVHQLLQLLLAALAQEGLGVEVRALHPGPNLLEQESVRIMKAKPGEQTLNLGPGAEATA